MTGSRPPGTGPAASQAVSVSTPPSGRGHSSGPWVRVGAGPITLAEVLERVGDSGDGATVLFLGTVRDDEGHGGPGHESGHEESRRVRALVYEAYESMAEEVLERLAQGVAERLGTPRVAIAHRTGRLEVGEVSVAVAVSSPHRAPAFDAARTLMDEVKRTLPIWKREIYVDGEGEGGEEGKWVEGTPICRPPDPEEDG